MRIFKCFVVVALLTAGATAAFAKQVTVNPSNISPSQINLSKVNLSNAQFYFQGPAEFYVTGIGYKGVDYSAVLDYNGKGGFSVKPPNKVTTAGKPVSINLSGVSLQVSSNGIQLKNVGVDGQAFKGTLTLTPQNRLELTNYTETGRLSSSSQPSGQSMHKIAMLNGKVTALEQKVSSLKQAATQHKNKISSLRQQLASSSSSSAPTASSYPTVIATGFSGGKGVYGNWKRSGNRLEQTNAGNLFAKYVAKVPQNATQYFYQFSGKATGSGWRGLGLHFLATNVKAANLYGYGKSYLLWVTRDPARLQTKKTFVQLYRSYDGVHMVKLISRPVSASIDQTNTYSVAVNRSTNTITVLLNGNKVFSYSPSQQIGTGTSVALRALGTVSFSSAQIRTK